MNNSNARKNIIYSLVLLAMVAAVYAWRARDGRVKNSGDLKISSGTVSLSGKTMGTDYQLIYLDEQGRNFQSSIDSLLNEFNLSVSVYEPTSAVNRLNVVDTLVNPSKTLVDALRESNRVYDLTSGALDPTQGPLERIWTFSASGARLKDSTDVRIFQNLVGLKKIIVSDTLIRKTNPGIVLDFSASAKGMALDQIAEFLEAKGVKNFLIRIGGENLTNGVNEQGELWKIGLFYLKDSTGSKANGFVALGDQAISTAGNFEEYYTRDSLKLAFKLDPRTGNPVGNGLLSVTVLAPEAKTADALADALLVLGWKSAIQLDSARNDLQMLLVYNERGGKMKYYASPELKPFLSFPIK
ncbi:FAD:protein FMN transferase [Algoriphagus litoralis]|uniref:FAD:protein FMN transferase n=1 Tax=Algoriphagus litoralis TaxID=2202829 RepID=UPI000DB9DA36|nr:FAD:protein FMN transferase [Algoriphagus litoralis]